MSTTFETVEALASYDEAFPPGWSPVTREQERAVAEQLRRDFPPEHHVEPAGDELPDPGTLESGPQPCPEAARTSEDAGRKVHDPEPPPDRTGGPG